MKISPSSKYLVYSKYNSGRNQIDQHYPHVVDRVRPAIKDNFDELHINSSQYQHV